MGDVFTVEFESVFHGKTKYVALYDSRHELYCTIGLSEWAMNFTYISEEDYQKRLTEKRFDL